MAKKASGKYAHGFCDRSGWRYPLNDLIEEYVQGRPTGLRVGRDIWDDDHPQNWQGTLGDYSDAEYLADPRPDLTEDESQLLWSWNPVGQVGLILRTSVGLVGAG